MRRAHKGLIMLLLSCCRGDRSLGRGRHLAGADASGHSRMVLGLRTRRARSSKPFNKIIIRRRRLIRCVSIDYSFADRRASFDPHNAVILYIICRLDAAGCEERRRTKDQDAREREEGGYLDEKGASGRW